MKRARKMILVPEDTFQPAQSASPVVTAAVDVTPSKEPDVGKKSLQATGDNFSRLDHEIYKVLRSKAAYDDYKKCLNYLQILRRYLFSETTSAPRSAKRIAKSTR